MNLVRATLRSDNSIYAQLDADVGPEAVRETAYDMGIKTRLNAYPAEGLGGLTRGVSPLEMANAYATLASGGWRHRPLAIKKVRFPDGKTDNLGKPRKHRAFSDGVTYEATKILKQNVTSGTGRPNATVIGCPAAGKTGTTDAYTDAWFVGYTPRLSTSVWLGHATSRLEMPGVTGGTIPAKIWGQYMKEARGSYCGDFQQPKTPFNAQPFRGRYSGGGGGGSSDPSAFGSTPGATATPADGGEANGGGGRNGGGGNGGGGWRRHGRRGRLAGARHGRRELPAGRLRIGSARLIPGRCEGAEGSRPPASLRRACPRKRRSSSRARSSRPSPTRCSA